MKQTASRQNRLAAAAVAWLAVCGIAGAAKAQTAASYQSDPTVTLESTVKSVDWSGAKLTMTLAVAAATTPTADWQVEGPAPADLERQGWQPSDVKPGDKFSVVVAPDNSKRRTAALLHIIFNNGRTLSTGRFGLASVIPPQTAGAADPMVGFYGNTEICSSATFECHVWYYPNHRFLLFSRDLQKDGSWPLRGVEGANWTEKVDGNFIECMVFDGLPIAPLCHSAIFSQKPGDHWTVYLANGTREERRLIAGHR